MLEHYRQLMRLVSGQMKRYKVLDAKGIVENVKKTQSKLASVQNIATEKYNNVAKVSNKYL